MDDYYSDLNIDFSHYLRVLRNAIKDSYKKVLFASFLMSIAAFVFTTTLKPQYKATAVMHVAPPTSAVFDIQEIFFNRRDPAFRETQVGIMRSRVLIDRVVESLKLYELPDFASEGSVFDVLSKGNDKSHKSSKGVLIQGISTQLQKSIRVVAQRESYLYSMSVMSSNPKVAADITNAWTRAYLKFVKESQEGESKESDQFLQERLVVVNKELRLAETELQKYKENQGIFGGSKQSDGLVNQELDQLSQKLLNAKQKRLEAEALHRKIIEIESSTRNFKVLPIVKNHSAVQSAVAELARLQSQKGELSKRYGNSHRKIVEINSQLASARSNINSQVNSVVAGLKAEYSIVKSNEDDLQKALNESKNNVQNLSRKQSGLLELEQKVASQREVYQVLLTNLNRGRAKGVKMSNDTFIVDHAVVPVAPVSNKANAIIFIVGFLSLLLGFFLAVVKEFFNNTITIDTDVATKLSMPCLGVVPMVDGGEQLSTPQMYSYFLKEKNSAFSECIRTTRSGLMLSSLDLKKRCILFTSSTPNEGKTTIAINTALAFGKLSKTLLIDCDLRKPSVDKFLSSKDVRHKGLSDLCLGAVKPDECIHRLPKNNIDVLCAGSVNPNPQELFCSEVFKKLLASLKDIYDVIIIDSPPSLGLSDTSLVAAHVDQLVFVVNSGVTPVSKIKASIQNLKKANAPISGVLVNQVMPDDLQDSYYYDYGYGVENESLKATSS